MSTIETYTPQQLDQLGRLGKYFEQGFYDPDEYDRIKKLGVEPQVYFKAISTLRENFKRGKEIVPFEEMWEMHTNGIDVDSPYYPFVNFGCDTIDEIDHLWVGASEAWSVVHCPCCIAEAGVTGIEDIEDMRNQPDAAYLILDTRTNEDIAITYSSMHMAIDHHCSAGIDIEKMVRMLNLAPTESERLHPYA